MKKLVNWIKKYNKKSAKCKKCKKVPLALKGKNTIGWGSAIFPQYIRKKTKVANKLKSIINSFFKKGYVTGTKTVKKKGKTVKKKVKFKCGKANFKFVKKDTKTCRLTCSKLTKPDKTLECGSFKTHFRK